MDIRTLQSTVIAALEDLKAHDVKAFSTTGLTDLFDRVVIATGTSNRHTKALAAAVRDKVKLKGGAIVSVEGAETGEWVLVDLGDMVVHIMQPSIRNYYNLEELWGTKPLVLKPSAVRASPAAPKAVPARGPTTRSAASKKGATATPASGKRAAVAPRPKGTTAAKAAGGRVAKKPPPR